ncbi:MAG: monovalent cation/H(+) antiporter subunit G [Woeseiaceae bacterium]|nr:monovalent cation/H(+) antiporter subunit G [Woeseiaceae bacterium]
MAENIAYALIFAGAAFCLIGAIGVLRFPDVFARMHSSGITDTLGALLVVSGLIVLAGFSLAAVKLLFILAFLGMTSPTSTHALAKAALQGGEKPLLTGESRESSP